MPRPLLYTNAAGVSVLAREDDGGRVLSFYVRWRNGADLSPAEVRELGALLLAWSFWAPGAQLDPLPELARRIAGDARLATVLAQLAERPGAPAVPPLGSL